MSTGSLDGSANGSQKRRSILPEAPEANPIPSARQPVIPLATLDAPTQRFYIIAIYIALQGWKLYDWMQVVENHEASFTLLLKWSFIDFAFLFGVPELRIPWLELSQPAVLSLYALHFMINYVFMFDITVWIHPAVRVFVRVLTASRSSSPSKHGSLLLEKHSSTRRWPFQNTTCGSPTSFTIAPLLWGSKSLISSPKGRLFPPDPELLTLTPTGPPS